MEVDDAVIFVSQIGAAEQESIVLLHGGMGSRNDFLSLAKDLASCYRLIAIDTRGHGRSTLGNLTQLSYQRLEYDVTAVLDNLNLQNAGILGHSDGGTVALRLAAARTVRPRFIITVGAHWDFPVNSPVRDVIQNVTAAEWRKKFTKQVTLYETENPMPNFSRLFDATKGMWLGSGEKFYPGTLVRSIECPLLVINGDEDFLVSRQHAFELVEQVQGARYLNLPFASHTVLEDSPKDLIPSLKKFIENDSIGK